MDRNLKTNHRLHRLTLFNLWIALLLVTTATATFAQTNDEQPVKVTPCELKKNPPLYNQRLVEVTGFFANAFEGHIVFDPRCSGWSGTWYTFSEVSEVVESIRITPVKDAGFNDFFWFRKNRPQQIARATVVGRFFSGTKTAGARVEYWGGYGHFGCCSLLAIQQVIAIDLNQRPDLDYRATVDQPNIDKPGCGYTILTDDEQPSPAFIKAQADAEQTQKDWVFTDPKRVATNRLAQILFVDQNSISLIQTKQGPGRFIYRWQPKGKRKSYMVVVSRPYWLSFYAADAKRVAWTLIGAFEESCDGRRSVTRIR